MPGDSLSGVAGHYCRWMVGCDMCGERAPGDPGTMPLTWVTSVENGKQRVYCERCAREHLRSIEAKLDSEWW